MPKSFEKITLVGISEKSISDAVEVAVKEASSNATVSWFEVDEIRGRLNSSGNLEYQVTVSIGRKLN